MEEKDREKRWQLKEIEEGSGMCPSPPHFTPGEGRGWVVYIAMLCSIFICMLINLTVTMCSSWQRYFLGAANYYFYGVGLGHYMQQYFVDQETAQWLVRYHNFISFNLYVIGFCGFVLSLKPGHYQFQFTQVCMWLH